MASGFGASLKLAEVMLSNGGDDDDDGVDDDDDDDDSGARANDAHCE